MAKNTEARNKLTGNPGRRPSKGGKGVGVALADQKVPPILRDEEEKVLWKLWAPPLIKAGRLTILTVPSLVDLIKMKVKLDKVNAELDNDLDKLTETTVYIDAKGRDNESTRESTLSKLSRDLTMGVYKLAKSWGLTADSALGIFVPTGKSSAEEFLSEDD